MKMTVDRDLVTPQPFRVWLSGASTFLSVWMHAGCRPAPPGARVSPEVSPCGVGAALLQGPDQVAASPPMACSPPGLRSTPPQPSWEPVWLSHTPHFK